MEVNASFPLLTCNSSLQFPLQSCIVEYAACIKSGLHWTMVALSLYMWCEQCDMPECPPTTEVLHGRNGTASTKGRRCGVQPRTRWPDQSKKIPYPFSTYMVYMHDLVYVTVTWWYYHTVKAALLFAFGVAGIGQHYRNWKCSLQGSLQGRIVYQD